MINHFGIICIFMMIIQGVIQFLYYERIYDSDKCRASRIKRGFTLICFMSLMVIAKVLGQESGTVYSEAIFIISVVTLIYLFHIFYTDSSGFILVHFSIIILQGLAADAIYRVVFEVDKNDFFYQYNTLKGAEACVVITLLFFIINSIHTLIYCNLRMKKEIKVDILWLFIILFVIAIIVFSYYFNKDNNSELYLSFASILTVCVFTIFMIYTSYVEKCEVKESIQNLEKVMEIEKVHYEDMEERIQEMDKIRHDYNNVLNTVKYLIKEGRTDEAEEIINDLTVRVNETKGLKFCSEPIINAVLNEKKEICSDADINVCVDIIVPKLEAIKALDLCMIFGNLMDNAIRACKEVGNSNIQPCIEITGRKVKGYVVFKCENTALENSKNKIMGTGFGHRILSDVAERYDGNFCTDYKNGIYTSCISLKI